MRIWHHILENGAVVVAADGTVFYDAFKTMCVGNSEHFEGQLAHGEALREPEGWVLYTKNGDPKVIDYGRESTSFKELVERLL